MVVLPELAVFRYVVGIQKHAYLWTTSHQTTPDEIIEGKASSTIKSKTITRGI
jgi:hypothetical protein